MMLQKVIAACIDRVLEFDTQNEAAKYIETLRDKGSEFKILHREEIGGKGQYADRMLFPVGQPLPPFITVKMWKRGSFRTKSRNEPPMVRFCLLTARQM